MSWFPLCRAPDGIVSVFDVPLAWVVSMSLENIWNRFTKLIGDILYEYTASSPLLHTSDDRAKTKSIWRLCGKLSTRSRKWQQDLTAYANKYPCEALILSFCLNEGNFSQMVLETIWYTFLLLIWEIINEPPNAPLSYSPPAGATSDGCKYQPITFNICIYTLLD